ncbi:hypothetical protein FQU76_10210 [Streptomyces qinzhouensis]|uniref:Secreted protein n=1 Tax=Streptomyces qinzhouensis TaxID=2599401 RepID=A0A5B8JLX9_9ACTN|nr:hypothetical protein [Streptomyces qinzhouensis]QDY80911.1 hypothetical protein FQU76_10210 [Streptomyces qinzhouensis]
MLLAVTALTLAGPGSPPAVAGPDRPAAGAYEVRATGPCSGKLARRIAFRTGELRVYQSRRYACAVTYAKSPGKRRPMALSIQVHGGRPVVDRGRYTRQAGPRTVHALNRCVRASGSVAGYGASTGWILC